MQSVATAEVGLSSVAHQFFFHALDNSAGEIAVGFVFDYIVVVWAGSLLDVQGHEVVEQSFAYNWRFHHLNLRGVLEDDRVRRR